LKGDRCVTKCPLDKKDTKQRGKMQIGSKQSEYAKRMREKQRAKIYTGMFERQFRKYFLTSVAMKGLTGENLLRLLEMRLDNVVRRLGFVSSQRFARQFVRHGHIAVNNRRVDIPSYTVSPGDVISVVESMRGNILVKQSLEKTAKHAALPSWLELNASNAQGKILKYPSREEMSIPVNEQFIVELYSK
jgi:small subunit ribosomal protein S4